MLGRSKNFTLRGFLWLLSLMAIPVILVMAHTSLVFAQNGTILTPHKAVYGISLASTFGAEAPSGIRGVMSFEFADKCNGWQTDTKILLRTAHGLGPEVEILRVMKTWETKDGSGFRFSFTESGGGQERFRVKGVAVMDEIGGVAEYSEPVQRRVPLPPGTLFPASHIAAVIKRADNGGGHFGHMVFGGTAANEPYQVSAVIGARENSEARHPEIEKFLGGVKSWKGRLAYFPVVVEKNTPEFELSIMIREDGIVEHIAQDYGDHVVDARLNQIEILPNLDCTVR